MLKYIFKKSKSEYLMKQIEECEGNQQKLFKIVDKLLSRGKSTSLPQYSDPKSKAQIYDGFFISKIAAIRTPLATLATSLDDIHCPLNILLVTSTTKLTHFEPTTISEIILL